VTVGVAWYWWQPQNINIIKSEPIKQVKAIHPRRASTLLKKLRPKSFRFISAFFDGEIEAVGRYKSSGAVTVTFIMQWLHCFNDEKIKETKKRRYQ
jgi:hypothetical protein